MYSTKIISSTKYRKIKLKTNWKLTIKSKIKILNLTFKRKRLKRIQIWKFKFDSRKGMKLTPLLKRPSRWNQNCRQITLNDNFDCCNVWLTSILQNQMQNWCYLTDVMKFVMFKSNRGILKMVILKWLLWNSWFFCRCQL